MIPRRSLTACVAVLAASFASLVSCENDRNGNVIAPLFFDTDQAYEAVRAQHSEPNDSLASAITIATNNRPLTSGFHRVDDIDYFVFTAAHNAAYIIQTLGLDTGVRTKIEVLENTGNRLATNMDGGLENGAALLVWSPIIGGIYYIRVTSLGDGIGTYQLKISVEEDGYEPDGSIATSKDALLIDGAFHQHTLHEMSDEDYIAFPVQAGFTYRAEVVSSVYIPNFQQPVILAIVDSLGNELVSNESDYTASVVTVAAIDGTHYVRVSPRTEEALGTYSVSVAVGADPYEPDNSIFQADSTGPIMVGEEQHRSISLGDEDYLSFDILDRHIYHFFPFEVSEGLTLRASIHHENGTSLQEFQTESWRWEAPTIPDSVSHRYYLRIVGTSDVPGTYSVSLIHLPSTTPRIGP